VTRDQHFTFIAQHGANVRFAGPLMSDDGERMVGSLLILEADSLDAAHAWSANDPYNKVGLFESVDIRPWRLVIQDGARREG
jgi:uncharacterized protein YciI